MASFLRKDYLDKKEKLWEDAQFPHSSKATPNACSGQSLENNVDLIDESIKPKLANAPDMILESVAYKQEKSPCRTTIHSGASPDL